MNPRKPQTHSSIFTWRDRMTPHLQALRIAALFLLFGFIWILSTDKILEFLFGNSNTYQTFQTFKGWLFVALTALFIYLLVIDTLRLYVRAQREQIRLNVTLKEQLAKTEASEARYQLAVQGSSDSIWEYDAVSRQLFSDTRLMTSLGHGEALIRTIEDWLRFVHPEDADRLRADLQAYLEHPVPILEATYRIQRKDGGSAWIKTRGYALLDPEGRIIKVAGSHTDITLAKNYEETLFRLAYYDTASGLPNWQGFGEIVDKQIREHPETPFNLLYLDIDDFKDINDVHGYTIGNLLLDSLATDLKTLVQAPDILAKLGGDGFGILTFDTDSRILLDLARRILTSIRRERTISQQILSVSASLGIARYPDKDTTFKTLMQSADEAMYEAKRSGKNTFFFFTEDTHRQRIEQISLARDLRKAIENHDFTLVYQPVIDLQNRKIVALECLLRWDHPERGPISPSVFIPLAENVGWIHEIELWVFAQAFRQIKIWSEEGIQLVPIAINLSAQGATDEAFITALLELQSSLDIPSAAYEIEITETGLVKNYGEVIHNLERLRQAGVRILLDDFGTGYSSLTYLVNLPIDVIKIDRAFITRIGVSADTEAVIRVIVQLAHGLKLHVVAEGIETDEQHTYLSAVEADYGQGYLFQSPAESKRIRELLMNGLD